MERRSFIQSLAGAGMMSQTGAPAGAQESNRKTRFYLLDYFHYRQGDQATRLTQFFTSQTPLIGKRIPTFGVFAGVLTPQVQTLMTLSGFAGMEEMAAAARDIESDAGYQKAHAELENGATPPYDTLQRVLLQALDFSPEVVPLAEKPKSPRYFELRLYHSPTRRQLQLVHERFAGAEINIFHRSGVHPLLYADTLIGPEMPNLTYLIPFDNLAAREKAWSAFGADEEWVRVRKASVERDGQITAVIDLSLHRATAYSPVR